MVWDILLQAAAAFVVGAAAGYAFVAIVEALSRAFARLWDSLVATVKEIWGYVTEATKYYLALVAQFLDNNWSKIESYLRQEFGYSREWLLAVFQDGLDTILAFVEPGQTYRPPFVISVRPVNQEEGVQLPTVQNPIVTKLTV
ncbi:MAG TPA: hypothetical protein IGS52_05270 [Oscillatoriaceae cyanobacterium M33_DOE_052]|uniref:Uncharacterized protein n=1 Tax=Planktothricoides sp. SpSt-374 TaxID=2282167 RepID=A0A7C3ZMJ0_9CYAN|nr:hypothetical protein [Oscillatoriaceae cyanobacterium M33_DOE_052]